MSVENVRQTMEAYLDALAAHGDYGRFFSDGITFDVLWNDTSSQGPRQVEETIRAVHEDAFDARSEVLRLVVGEDSAAAELSFAGRHIGEFRGVEPTGRLVRVAYSAFFEVADGRIAALRIYLPVERLLGQIRGRTVPLEELFPEVVGGEAFFGLEPEPELRRTDVPLDGIDVELSPQLETTAARTSDSAGRNGSLWGALRAALRRSDREGSRTSRDAVR
jgi:predicted ester cyclase